MYLSHVNLKILLQFGGRTTTFSVMKELNLKFMFFGFTAFQIKRSQIGNNWFKTIVFFIFTPPSNIASFIFGASFGFLWLSTVPATSGIVAHLFGTKYLGLLYGLVFLSHQFGSFFGAYLGGLFHDTYGSYDYAWYLAIALSVFAAIIHLPIKEEPVLRLKTE